MKAWETRDRRDPENIWPQKGLAGQVLTATLAWLKFLPKTAACGVSCCTLIPDCDCTPLLRFGLRSTRTPRNLEALLNLVSSSLYTPLHTISTSWAAQDVDQRILNCIYLSLVHPIRPCSFYTGFTGHEKLWPSLSCHCSTCTFG